MILSTQVIRIITPRGIAGLPAGNHPEREFHISLTISYLQVLWTWPQVEHGVACELQIPISHR